MKKSLLMICCILATSFILTGCEETEVKKSPAEIDMQEALQLLHEQFPNLGSTNPNGRTQAQALTATLTSAYEQGSTFEVSAKVNKVGCYLDGNTFTTYWLWYNGNTKIWKNWATKTGACLADGNTHGPLGVTQKTTPIWFYAFVYSSFNNQNTLWGEGMSNGVVLNRPF
jgi:hypothetical protein